MAIPATTIFGIATRSAGIPAAIDNGSSTPDTAMPRNPADDRARASARGRREGDTVPACHGRGGSATGRGMEGCERAVAIRNDHAPLARGCSAGDRAGVFGHEVRARGSGTAVTRPDIRFAGVLGAILARRVVGPGGGARPAPRAGLGRCFVGSRRCRGRDRRRRPRRFAAG